MPTPPIPPEASGAADPPTALVTGASGALGRAVAKGLAARGWRVILHGRNADKLARSAKRVGRLGPCETVQADLADLDDVRALAETVRSRTGRLDALVNNAGLLAPTCRLTDQRIETTMAVNAVAPWVLFTELRPLLEATAQAHGEARLVNVTSAAHRGGRFDKAKPKPLAKQLREPARGYSSFKAYCQSKLALTAWTMEAARRLEGTGVTANCCHPGVVRTGIFPGLGGPGGFFAALFSIFYLPPRLGAKPPLALAASPEWTGKTGRFLTRGHFRGPHEKEVPEQGRDPEWTAAVWDAVARLAEP